MAQLEALDLRVLVLLGATASKAIFGWDFRVTQRQGDPLDGLRGLPTVATIHPSAVLRRPTPAASTTWTTLVRVLGVAADLARVAGRG
jgi:uracil-DNA glycosylase